MPKSKYGRRPIEYILYVVLAMLVVFAFWSVFYVRGEDGRTSLDESAGYDSGTPEEINSITQKSIKSEEAIFKEADRYYDSNVSDLEAVTNNIGGVYDETSY